MAVPDPPHDRPALRVLLVRHGESTWNAVGRWQGQADPPLSRRGRAQARAAAVGLPPLGLVVASDLARARETAGLLAAPHGYDVRIDDGLRERDAGGFTGLTRPEIHLRYPGAVQTGDAFRPPEGWEPDAAVLERAWRSLDCIADGSAGTVVAVTHSGVIHAVEHALGTPRARIANLEGRWIDRRNGDWVAGERQLLVDPRLATRPPTP